MAIRRGLLALLDEGPAYGYQLKAAFEERTGAHLAAQHRAGLHDPGARRARRPRGPPRGRRRGSRHLRDHRRRPRARGPVVRRAGAPRGRAARRARDQARGRGDRAGRRRALHRADPAHRDHARAAGAHPAQDVGRRRLRPRLAARPRPADLRPRGRGPLARPLRVAHRARRRRGCRRPPQTAVRRPTSHAQHRGVHDDNTGSGAPRRHADPRHAAATAVHALRGVVAVASPPASWSPSWGRAARASRPCSTSPAASTPSPPAPCWSRARDLAALSRPSWPPYVDAAPATCSRTST